MRKSVVAALTAAVLLPLLSGCASPSMTSPQADGPSAADLIGTWSVDASFDTPEQPFIAFVDDNTWTASDGCNRVQGTWNLGASGALTTTSGPHTLMWCDGAQLPVTVTLADSVAVDDDTLTITSSQDATVTELIRTTDARVGIQDSPIGYWVETPGSTGPFLSLSADGTYTGNDGCNVINGTWESTGDGAISLVPGATTLMACPGTDDWLRSAGSALLRDGTLTVQSVHGDVLGQLVSPSTN